MVLDYYGLAEQPFGVTPDPRYLYSSPTHREALASLAYGIQSGRGFMSIIARPGMGKTTILFHLLRNLERSARTVFLFQTLCSPQDFLRSLLCDLGVQDDCDDVVRMRCRLNDLLIKESREGRRVVVVIDEAQNLDESVLEIVRMFSNFETPRDKLIQIVLAGQPQLARKLASPNLVQLRQRISIMGRLQPFSPEETKFYVGHRLRVAGYNFRAPLFTRRAGLMIAECSDGVPRNINNICFNALALGCASRQRTIDGDIIEEVLRDLDLEYIANDSTVVAQSATRERYISEPARWLDAKLLSRPRVPRLASVATFLLTLSWSLAAGEARARVPAPSIAPSTLTRPEAPMSSITPEFAPGAANLESVSLIADRRDRSRGLLESSKAGRDGSFGLVANTPAGLWKQIGKENTKAELRLAKLYMVGEGITQDCEQARVLLSAASKQKKESVQGLLGEYSRVCH